MSGIKVYCDEAAHEGREAVVGTFRRMQAWTDGGEPDGTPESDGPPSWQVSGKRVPRGRRGPLRRYSTGHTATTVRLKADGEVAASRFRDPALVDHETVHLACPLCTAMKAHGQVRKVTVVQVRQDRLNSILDTLAAHGVSRISLRALGARLQSES